MLGSNLLQSLQMPGAADIQVELCFTGTLANVATILRTCGL
jgi:hypothetical protein